MNEFVIISKDVFEEMVGKFNRFSDRVNEILGKREEGRLSRWMDNQDVCQQLRISPRTLQTLRDNGTLAYSQIGIRFSTSRKTYCVLSSLWRIDERMQPIGERLSEYNQIYCTTKSTVTNEWND